VFEEIPELISWNLVGCACLQLIGFTQSEETVELRVIDHIVLLRIDRIEDFSKFLVAEDASCSNQGESEIDDLTKAFVSGV